MATFEVKVHDLTIESHPNADALEVARVGDYRSVVRKGQFKTGDVGIYIPEAAVLPDWLIEKLGLVGKLAGKEKNRVTAVKLRGVLSQGLICPIDYCSDLLGDSKFDKGQDLAELLGITKYEPPIPVHMAGEVFNARGYTLKYDIENIKKYPLILTEGEQVVMTEKLHGTWTCFGFDPEVGLIITSKGLSGQGVAFKINDANKNNLYIRTFYQVGGDRLIQRVQEYFNEVFGVTNVAFYILGETFGAGVQDLHYGQSKPTFRIFDVFLGSPDSGRYLNDDEKEAFCRAVGIPRVPVLYRGPFTKEAVELYTNGKETLSGKGANVREGVVINPVVERSHPKIGRVILKSVSEAYLLRGGNATELA